jgi:hypothetical protein
MPAAVDVDRQRVANVSLAWSIDTKIESLSVFMTNIFVPFVNRQWIFHRRDAESTFHPGLHA